VDNLLFNQAGIFDTIIGFFSNQSLEAIGAVLILAIGFLTKKYIVPLLQKSLAKETASHLLLIADDVTDYFIEKYPNAKWSDWLNRAVDKIIEITGVGEEQAERVAIACLARKKTAMASMQASAQAMPVTGRIEAQS